MKITVKREVLGVKKGKKWNLPMSGKRDDTTFLYKT